MKLTFPDHFIFGTGTAACQIETAFGHDWEGHRSQDGFTLDRTTDHEKRYPEDIEIIASLAPNYRMSLMWSRLQRAPFSKFDDETLREYRDLIFNLRSRGVNIMMVLHHFANPVWFSERGGWANTENIPLWLDYAYKVVDEFGDHVSLWNTFNEPNLYASLGWALGLFPPYKKNIITAIKVLNNLGQAHDQVYDYIKKKYPKSMVGISHNCTVFTAENLLGFFPAKISDMWFMEYAPRHFKKVDFFGMSYYARISHDPFPLTYLYTPEKLKKLGRDHDDMWEYYPQGLRECINRYWHQYKKPIIITENGICTNDDTKRVQAIHDYMKIVHDAIADGVDVRGYYYWSTWDNFEWTLGPSYKFGLYECDLETKARTKRPSADVFSALAYNQEISIP
ncbi:MAG TPA: family 1 glycosylhydrolase [Cyclobacteriaceae bacterium]|jgi:beta-glucosidase|nr:family 1 glycosylhydrolase [Cyclobacteriaceae bacterium]